MDLLGWLRDSNSGTQINGQLHWENTDSRTQVLFGASLNRPCFKIFEAPSKPFDRFILKGLLSAALGIKSEWFGIDPKTSEFTIIDRSILHSKAIFPFSSALKSLS